MSKPNFLGPYSLISPSGKHYDFYEAEGYTTFCRERGLCPNNLRKVALGQEGRTQHKGWVATTLKEKSA